MQIVLTVYNSRETKQVAMDTARFTIGRASAADLVINDESVELSHASIYRDDVRVWILDEGSEHGTLVDGKLVPPSGLPLRNGAEINLGNETTIVVNLRNDTVAEAAHRPSSDLSDEPSTSTQLAAAQQSFSVPLVVGLLAALLVFAGVVVFASYAFVRGGGKQEVREQPRLPDSESSPIAEASSAPVATVTSAEQTVATPSSRPQDDQQTTISRKLYLQMNPQEQMDFIDQQARHISLMMGNRPYAFNDDVLRYIKQYLDGYAKRVGNNSTKLWGEDLRLMFARAREQYAPYIIRSFNARGVPPVVGLYLVVVETEYHNIQSENAAGAAGLFQFIGPTARGYGVEPAERTNVAKMAPAAAAYMADRIAEFGPDSMSVALGIAGYNRSPDSVRRDLRDVLNSENRERSFWTLVANSNKLDHYFQGENIKYVPKFFAAAIVGETPWAFGIQMQPLSTYTEIKSQPDTGDKE